MATYIPISIRLTVLLIILSEHILPYMIPTIIAYMVHDFLASSGDLNSGNTHELVSFYVGLIEGANRLMSFLGCLVWGTISDRLSRKYSLIIVLFIVSISSTGFGLSRSYSVALIWIMLSGFCGGTIPIAKAMLRDLSDNSNIAVLYSYFGTGAGLASIISPLIGGVFSHPYKYFPGLFDTDFFHQYPYFLPLFIHSLISLLSLTMLFVYIPYHPAEKASAGDTASLFKNKLYLAVVGAYCFIALSQYSYRTLMSLWVKVDVENYGLGWGTEKNPGYMNALSGIIIAVFPFFYTSVLHEKFGIVHTLKLLLLLIIPLVGFISFTYLFDGILLWILLVLCNGFCFAFITCLVSFMSIAASNSVSSNTAGSALGICQSAAALSRVVATTGTAGLFGWSQGWRLFFPFNTHFTFFVLICVFAAGIIYIHAMLDDSIEKRKVNETEIPLVDKIKE